MRPFLSLMKRNYFMFEFLLTMYLLFNSQTYFFTVQSNVYCHCFCVGTQCLCVYYTHHRSVFTLLFQLVTTLYWGFCLNLYWQCTHSSIYKQNQLLCNSLYNLTVAAILWFCVALCLCLMNCMIVSNAPLLHIYYYIHHRNVCWFNLAKF